MLAYLSMDPVFVALALALGASAGVLSAFFGIGGGLLVTPFLLAAGVGGAEAVGTSFLFLCVTSLFSILEHRRHGVFEPRAGLLAGLALIPGVEMGRRIIFALSHRGWSDATVQGLTIGFLLFVAIRTARNRPRPSLDEASAAPLNHPTLFAGALGIGLLSGLMGVGGGLFLVPLLMHAFGLSPARAVAASLLAVVLGGMTGALGYAWSGQANPFTAMLLLATALPCTRLGARALHRAAPGHFRTLFIALLGIGIFVTALKLAGFQRGLAPMLTAVAVALSTWIAAQGFRRSQA